MQDLQNKREDERAASRTTAVQVTFEPPFSSSEAMNVGNSMATLEPDDEDDCTVALHTKGQQRMGKGRGHRHIRESRRGHMTPPSLPTPHTAAEKKSKIQQQQQQLQHDNNNRTTTNQNNYVRTVDPESPPSSCSCSLLALRQQRRQRRQQQPRWTGNEAGSLASPTEGAASFEPGCPPPTGDM